jgi:hypothetical protein
LGHVEIRKENQWSLANWELGTFNNCFKAASLVATLIYYSTLDQIFFYVLWVKVIFFVGKLPCDCDQANFRTDQTGQLTLAKNIKEFVMVL